jgi:hypothetical protein
MGGCSLRVQAGRTAVHLVRWSPPPYKRRMRLSPVKVVGRRMSAEEGKLVFSFKPDLSALLSPTAAPEGSDSWALNVDAVSVTPYLTSFAELPESEHGFSSLQDREWKFKL